MEGFLLCYPFNSSTIQACRVPLPTKSTCISHVYWTSAEPEKSTQIFEGSVSWIFRGSKIPEFRCNFLTTVSVTALSFQTAATYQKSETNPLSNDDRSMSFSNLVQFSRLNSDRKYREVGKKVDSGM